MTRLIAIPAAAVLLAVAACYKTGPTYALGEAAAYDLVVGLAEMALDAGEGTSVHQCPLGGETTVNATTASGQQGDTTVSSGRWALVPAECWLNAAGSRIMVSGNPDITFTSEAAVIAGQGGHIAVAIRGAIHWRTAEGGESCLFDLALETTETDASGSFTGTLTGRACGDTVIPLSAVELLQPAAK